MRLQFAAQLRRSSDGTWPIASTLATPPAVRVGRVAVNARQRLAKAARAARAQSNLCGAHCDKCLRHEL